MIKLIAKLPLIVALATAPNFAFAQSGGYDCKRCVSVSSCGPVNPGYSQCSIGPDYRNQKRCINLGIDCHTDVGKADTKYKKEDVKQVASKGCTYKTSAA